MRREHPATVSARQVDMLLAAAPVCSLADAELAETPLTAGRYDTLDGFGASSLTAAVLSPDAQLELVAVWQWMQTARSELADGTIVGPARRRLERAVAARSRYAEAWAGTVHRYARTLITKEAAQRNITFDEHQLQDILGDAAVLAFDAASTFDATLGVTPLQWFADLLRKRWRDMANRARNTEPVPTTWKKVARWADQAEEDFFAVHGRAPHRDELYAATQQKARDWARGTLGDSADVDAAIDAKLIRQGYANAFTDFDRALVHRGAPLTLDMVVGDGENTFADLIVSDVDPVADEAVAAVERPIGMLVDDAFAAMPPANATAVKRKLAGDDHDEEGPSVSTVNREIRNMRVRVCAPHAQWCGLVAHEGMFTEAVDSVAELFDLSDLVSLT